MRSHDTNDITPSQVRAARALIGMTAADLASAARVGLATVRRIEAAEGGYRPTAANLAAIRAALEAAGVIFIDENGQGPGVRLRKNDTTP